MWTFNALSCPTQARGGLTLLLEAFVDVYFGYILENWIQFPQSKMAHSWLL